MIITTFASFIWAEENYTILNMCPIDRHFTEGIELLEDGKTMMLSSGLFNMSKLIAYQFDLDTCVFEQVTKHEMKGTHFAEGVIVDEDKNIY